MGKEVAPFTYDLPAERIAQRPAMPYDSAKLLVVQRHSSQVGEYRFSNICDFLRPEDVLVFNNTKVLPARLFGHFEAGGEIELLLLERQGSNTWICLGRPLKRFSTGRILEFEHGLRGRVVERISSQKVAIQFYSEAGDVSGLLRQCGVMPIPPYIRSGHSDEKDIRDYQTHFAEHEGSVAAPTASLHFTPALMDALKARGCFVVFVTLHLGTASFLPLWQEGSPEVIPPGEERGFVHREALDAIHARRAGGGRVIAIGTSVVRLLESAARIARPEGDMIRLKTDLFIEPGFEFKLVDGLVTNFHQPRTTHLLLVQAFMGQELLRQSYDFALSHDFRFLSYGDGMLIL